jgi:hypothetical protein
MKAKAITGDASKQITSVIEQMTPNYRTTLVAIAVSVVSGNLFSFVDACLFVNAYCSTLRLEHVTQMQVEQALEYFLQSGLIEIVSNNHTMRKLGRGSRAHEVERVSLRCPQNASSRTYNS